MLDNQIIAKCISLFNERNVPTEDGGTPYWHYTTF